MNYTSNYLKFCIFASSILLLGIGACREDLITPTDEPTNITVNPSNKKDSLHNILPDSTYTAVRFITKDTSIFMTSRFELRYEIDDEVYNKDDFYFVAEPDYIDIRKGIVEPLNAGDVKLKIFSPDSEFSDSITIHIDFIELVHIEKGSFIMGSQYEYQLPAGSEDDINDVEKPHKVTLTQDFEMGKYPITCQQFACFLNAMNVPEVADEDFVYMDVPDFGNQLVMQVWKGGTPYYEDGRWIIEPAYRNEPMSYVSWYGAKAFCNWAGCKLPTEAQWEYACRAGTETTYYWGEDASEANKYAWYLGHGSGTKQLVGQLLPNAWGLYDMLGLVTEWCEDWHDDYYYLNSPEVDPVRTSETPLTDKIHRGGSFSRPLSKARCAARSGGSPSTYVNSAGFRVIFQD